MKITTIGWWNGQSNLLQGFYEYMPEEIKIRSIVSMSDDGRTTWVLMNLFREQLGIHLPPPWDLRRCLFSLSKSEHREFFQKILESSFTSDDMMSIFSVRELFDLIISEVCPDYDIDIEKYLESQNVYIMDYFIPITATLKGHKFGNILMWIIFYNTSSYEEMLSVMHKMLKVRWKVLPITTDKALIKAKLDTWKTIYTQDNISNNVNYEGNIVDIDLMDSSKDARTYHGIVSALQKTDFIIISPWDLYTSNYANFIIKWFREALSKSKAKIIYVMNNANKGWETSWYTVKKFVDVVENGLWKKIDYLVLNNEKIDLTDEDRNRFKKDISVKWGSHIYLEDAERVYLKEKWIKIVEWNFLDKKTLYKHNKENITKSILTIINY